MGEYKEVTSSLEGRLFLSSTKPRLPSANFEDFFQPRPETQATVNSWLSLKANNPNAPTKATGDFVKSHDEAGSVHKSAGGPYRKTDKSLAMATVPESCQSTTVNQSSFKVTIELAEPVLHLEGFDASHSRAHRSTVLRGFLRLEVVHKVTLRELSLSFHGSSKTEWPESWRLRKLKKICDEKIMTKSWDFIRGDDAPTSRKANKSKTFEPGVHVVNFELPLESSLPETITLPLGAVSYSLTATATSDTGSKSASCTQEVTLIRIPCACSLELVEPYGVHGSQHGLRYSFGLFAKSVAIGGRVPLSMRIASIPEVMWERVTVCIIEDVQYRTRDGMAQREQSRTKAMLLEKRATVVQDPLTYRAARRISTTGEKLRHAHAAAVHIEKPPRRGSNASSEPEVNLLEKITLRIPTCSVLQADTAYRCIYVRHHLVITILSRIELDQTTHRNFEVQIKVPIQILTCKINKDSTNLPEYSPEPVGTKTLDQPPGCRCDRRSRCLIEMPEPDEDDSSMLERWTSGSIVSAWRHDLPGYDDPA